MAGWTSSPVLSLTGHGSSLTDSCGIADLNTMKAPVISLIDNYGSLNLLSEAIHDLTEYLVQLSE